MRVLHVAPRGHPFPGGLESLSWDIVKAQSQEREVFLLCGKHDMSLPIQEKKENVHISRFSSVDFLKDRYGLPYKSFYNTIAKIKPDILFTHTRFFPSSFLAGWSIRKKFPSCRWVHIEHGQNSLHVGNVFLEGVGHISDQIFGRWIFRHADQTIVVSPTAEKFARSLGAKNIRIIPSGVEIPGRIHPLPRKNKALFFGRMVREKGVREILFAAEKSPQWHVTLVGDGPLFGFRSLPNVTWEKSVSREKIRSFLRASDLVLLPSYSESLSLSVLESASEGRAIVASDVGENKSLLSPDFLFPPRDKESLCRMLQKNTNCFDILSQEGKRNYEFVAQNYSIESMQDAYKNLL